MINFVEIVQLVDGFVYPEFPAEFPEEVANVVTKFWKDKPEFVRDIPKLYVRVLGSDFIVHSKT